MARIKASLPNGVHASRNEGGLVVTGRSEPGDGTDKLMEWVGVYAEGVDTVVVVDDILVEYDDGGDGKVKWVERMLGRWRFEVKVPGASE